MCQMKHYLLILMLIIISPILVYANIPELVPIPEGLSVTQNEKFMQSKTTLEKRWNILVSKVESHNQKCNNVASNTQLSRDCHKKMGELQSKIALYVQGVEQFNNDIAKIIQDIKSQVVIKEQNEYENKTKEWLTKQWDLIRQAITSQKELDKKMLLAINQNKVPKLPQRTLSDLKPGDVILLKQGEGMFSHAIPYGDILIRWMQSKSVKPKKYDISHSVLYLKTVNGKRLYLDHQLGSIYSNTDGFARVIDEATFLERYEKRLSYVARPKAQISGKKLWEAAKGAALKDNTPYGLFGKKKVVCSEVDKFAIVQASDKKMSFLNKSENWIPISMSLRDWIPVSMTPANYIDPKTKGKYFVVTTLKK